VTARIGSLCTGYGGLDDAVQQTFGGHLAWVADNDPGATAILAHHYPDVPNLGDITAIHWPDVPPVDVLTMGFPCQDVSVAGQRAGLLEGNRSGVWRHCARAIEALQPSLVVIENVPGLLSAPADGDVEPCPWCLGDPGDEPPLRALGAVLADLASLGFDAEWTSLDASAVGACHKRRRVFILAWPAHTQGSGLEDGGQGRPARDAADASDAQGVGRGEGRPESARQQGRPSAVGGGGAPASHTNGNALREQPVAVPERCGTAVAGLAAAEPPADPAGIGHGNPGPSGERGMAAPTVTDRPATPAHTPHVGLARGGAAR
jgi:DNA (cytosine-5)-methyltransferase 1